MTKETRTFVEPSDIIAIEFECAAAECGTRVHVPLASTSKITKLPEKCPNCSAALVPASGPQRNRIDELVRQLRHSADPEMGLGVKVRLQVQCESEDE